MHPLQRALILIEAYAATADEAAAHARREAGTADGTARRLWQEEEMRERARSEAYRQAISEIRSALQPGQTLDRRDPGVDTFLRECGL